MITNRFLFVIGAIVVTTALDLTAAEPAPGTPKKPVSTEYQGVTVEDPYQWLEKDDEPDVKAWSAAQNQRTRQYLGPATDRDIAWAADFARPTRLSRPGRRFFRAVDTDLLKCPPVVWLQ